jgi:hypothetical protein
LIREIERYLWRFPFNPIYNPIASRPIGSQKMAKPTSFSRSLKTPRSGSTSFSFGANAPAFTTNARVLAARGATKKGSGRRAMYATGGGS